jgi:hypothetical protein
MFESFQFENTGSVKLNMKGYGVARFSLFCVSKAVKMTWRAVKRFDAQLTFRVMAERRRQYLALSCLTKRHFALWLLLCVFMFQE